MSLLAKAGVAWAREPKDSSGKVIRGKYVLKSQYILLSDDKKEQKEVGDWDFWKI